MIQQFSHKRYLIQEICKQRKKDHPIQPDLTNLVHKRNIYIKGLI